MAVTNTVNVSVAEEQTKTPGMFRVLVKTNPTETGYESGPFSTREAAEACVLAAIARPNVLSAVIQ
jgi:hypothetical protein